MKTVFGTMAFILCFLGAFSQGNEGKVPLGYLTANFSNPSFVNGNLKSFNYNAAGQLTSEAEFTREEMGRIKTSTLKNSEGIITNQTEYYYSTSHYEPVSMDIKITNGKPADVKGRREHFFDERGNWIRQVRYVNNEPVNITERVFTFYE